MAWGSSPTRSTAPPTGARTRKPSPPCAPGATRGRSSCRGARSALAPRAQQGGGRGRERAHGRSAAVRRGGHAPSSRTRRGGRPAGDPADASAVACRPARPAGLHPQGKFTTVCKPPTFCADNLIADLTFQHSIASTICGSQFECPSLRGRSLGRCGLHPEARFRQASSPACRDEHSAPVAPIQALALQEKTGFRLEREHVCGRPRTLRHCG